MLGSARSLATRLSSVRNMSQCTPYIPKDRLKGKVAVVTASTAGIGLATARRLGLEGAKVVICSRKEKNVEEALKQLQNECIDVDGIKCHVGNKEDRKKLLDLAVCKYGGIDILVSNAAANPAVGPVLETDEKAWDKIFDTNVKASFMLAKEVLPHLRKRPSGRIIFVASIGGLQPFSLLGTYSVTKTALLGLTKAAAADLATENITVNSVCPGVIKTKFSQALHDGPAKEASLAQIPMQKFGTPEDCAGLIAYLASDDAQYITGENMVIAGGMQSRL